MSKRRKWSAEEKLRIVLAGMQPGVEVSGLCGQEGINPTMFYYWKKKLPSSAKQVFDEKAGRPSAIRYCRLDWSIPPGIADRPWAGRSWRHWPLEVLAKCSTCVSPRSASGRPAAATIEVVAAPPRLLCSSGLQPFGAPAVSDSIPARPTGTVPGPQPRPTLIPSCDLSPAQASRRTKATDRRRGLDRGAAPFRKSSS
jgi:hypothetical protein